MDISLGGTYNTIICSDIDDTFREPESVEDLSAIMADGKWVRIKGLKPRLDQCLKKIVWGWSG